jgi:hypothetical protein
MMKFHLSFFDFFALKINQRPNIWARAWPIEPFFCPLDKSPNQPILNPAKENHIGIKSYKV